MHTQTTHQNTHTHKQTSKQKLNRLPKIYFTDLFYLLCTLITTIIIIVIMVIITLYSKFQFKICFDKVIEFLKKLTSLNTRLAAKTHLAVEEFLRIAKNKEWCLKLHKGTLIPVASKRDGQYFRPE